jgi:hypothetical protein
MRDSHGGDSSTSLLWDMTLFIMMKTSRRFGGKFQLHLPGLRVSQTRNKQAAYSKKSSAFFVQVYCMNYSSALRMESIFSSETSGELQQTTRR